MSLQTIRLMDIMLKQAEAIRDSEAVKQFCLEKYGRGPQIRLGYDVKDAPGKGDCPVILIPRAAKAEGESNDPFRYITLIGWMVYNDQKVVENGIQKLTGLDECDELGQLIYETICQLNPSHPVSESTYEIEAVEFFPLIVGEMQLTVDVVRTIGTRLVY